MSKIQKPPKTYKKSYSTFTTVVMKVKPFLNWTQPSLDFLLSSALAGEGIWRLCPLNAYDLGPRFQDFKICNRRSEPIPLICVSINQDPRIGHSYLDALYS